MEKNQVNNQKIIKRILILFSLIALAFTIYMIAQIYALFYTEAQGTTNHNIAKWVIVVNEVDIVSAQVEEFSLGTFNVEGTSGAEGKFSPGMTGYYEIVIEPRNTQVSVRYDITVDDTSIKANNIHLIAVEETKVKNTITRTGKNTYTGIIPLSAINGTYINNIKFIFKWEEGENPDEEAALNISSVQVPMQVKVTQYLGEHITEYVSE